MSRGGCTSQSNKGCPPKSGQQSNEIRPSWAEEMARTADLWLGTPLWAKLSQPVSARRNSAPRLRPLSCSQEAANIHDLSSVPALTSPRQSAAAAPIVQWY